mgnify:CR=1 FL=1
MKILITLLKPLSFLPALLMMYIIFSFSAQPGEVSGNLSYKISYEIIETKSELLSENLSSEEIAYKATPEELVEKVEIDCATLRLGDTLKVADLDIAKNDKIDLQTDLDAPIVSILASNNEVPEDEEESAEE